MSYRKKKFSVYQNKKNTVIIGATEKIIKCWGVCDETVNNAADRTVKCGEILMDKQNKS